MGPRNGADRDRGAVNGLIRCHCAGVPSFRCLLLLLAFAGCATRQPAPAPDVPPQNPLAHAAWVEWHAWGRVVVDGWTPAQPLDTAATPARFERLTAYWDSLYGGHQIARRHEQLRQAMRASADPPPADGAALRPVSAVTTQWEDIGLYASPAWSAAFISAVARFAGVPERDLPSSSRHARYVDAMLARWRTDPGGAAFVPHAPEEYAPREGDLVCADRTYTPLTHWTQRLATTGRPRPMHCDVVIRTASGVVAAIGGNVLDLVTLRRFPAYADGRLVPAPPDYPAFFLILEARAVTPIAPVAQPVAVEEAGLGE
jgi:hypothetical protein